MDKETKTKKEPKEMGEDEILARIIRLGFGGDRKRYETFCEKLRAELPKGTGVALRGSVLTAERWEDGAPFDVEGSGTSDLDITLIGNKVKEYWLKEGFYIPALHTKPLHDEDPGVAPHLEPLRTSLQRLVGRPVSFQATSDIILFARDVLFDQPYFVVIEAEEDA
jgi:hypothetical protein